MPSAAAATRGAPSLLATRASALRSDGASPSGTSPTRNSAGSTPLVSTASARSR